MESSPTIPKQISDEAIGWFLRLQNPDQTSLDRKAFSEWLMRSPMHIEEYLAISIVWEALDVPQDADNDTESLIRAAKNHDDEGNVVRLQRHDLSDARNPAIELNRGITRRHWMGLSGALVLSTCIWLGYRSWHQATDFETAVGEQRSISLTDGSVVFLNTNSKIRVRWTAVERHIDLIRGEAQFQVAKNPSCPFVVATKEAAVRALGTMFNVRANRMFTQVAVLEGRVKVNALRDTAGAVQEGDLAALKGADTRNADTPASIELVAGERASVTANRIELGSGPSIESVTAWTKRRLIFRDESLAEVVSEFNRYRRAPLVIDDPQLATLRMSGVIGLNDPNSLVDYLRTFEAVQITRLHDGSVHLSRSAPN